MRKRITAILTVMLICVAAMGQTKLRQEEFYLGAQGGALASMVRFNPTVQQQALHCYLGPTAGLVFRYIGHRVCGFQVEVNYMQRGWQEYGSSGKGYRRQLDYIEIPFLTHLYFGKKARGYFNFGPQIGYLVHESEQNVIPIYSGIDMEQRGGSLVAQQYAASEKPFDWGMAVGLGFYYRTKSAGTYQLGARFNYSLGTLFDSSRMDYYSASNNMNLSLSIAYMWQIKQKR